MRVEKIKNVLKGSDSDSSMRAGSRQYKNALIRRFDFSSGLQRMSVICRNQIDNQFRAFIKGSPEKIAELSIPSSLPNNYTEIMEKYTKDGYRVIALASKALPSLNYRKAQTITRDQIECDVEFLGLLIMENKLKP